MSAHLQRFRQSKAVLSRRVGAEVILAARERRDFNALEGPAAEAWRFLEVPRTLPDLAAAVARRFDEPAERVFPEVSALLDDLIERGLIEEVVEEDV